LEKRLEQPRGCDRQREDRRQRDEKLLVGLGRPTGRRRREPELETGFDVDIFVCLQKRADFLNQMNACFRV
jgi:hypothetical protein